MAHSLGRKKQQGAEMLLVSCFVKYSTVENLFAWLAFETLAEKVYYYSGQSTQCWDDTFRDTLHS